MLSKSNRIAAVATEQSSGGATRKNTVASTGTIDGTGTSASGDYRVAVFGAGGVGKSSIVLRFVKGTFSDSYVPTIEDTYQQVQAQRAATGNDSFCV